MANSTDVVAQEVESRLSALNANVEDTCKSLTTTAETMQLRAERSRRWDIILRSSTAILAVASPALVTYSTTANVQELYKLAAILLTAIAGAATTLQAIFGLRQSYVRSANAALSLRQIIRDLRSSAREASSKPDIESPGRVRSHLDTASVKAAEVVALVEKSTIGDYGTPS